MKNKATVNEFQDEKISIEEYKKEIKKLREELNFKDAEKEKVILQQVMKTNESLTYELENFKGKYQIEKERNEQMRSEMDNIKISLNVINGNKQFTSSQYSNNNTNHNQSNNNSNFISSKENFFPVNTGNQYVNQNKNNMSDNLISSLNDDMKFANFIETNNNSQNELSNCNMPKQKHQNNNIKNINMMNNNFSPTKAVNNYTNNETYIETILNKINRSYLLEGIKNNQWQEDSQKIGNDFK